MSRTKFNLLAASAVLIVGLLTAGVVAKTAAPAPAPDQAAKPNPAAVREPIKTPAPRPEDDDKKPEEKLDRREGTIKSIDAAGGKLVVTQDEDKFDLTVDTDAKTVITVGRRATKLADLKEGMRAEVHFLGGEKTARKVVAGWPRLDADVKAIDAPANKLTIKTEGKNGFDFDFTFGVAADATVEMDGIPVGLADLKTGGEVKLEFAADKKTVVGIEADAEKSDLSAEVKTADAKGVTLVVQVAGHREERKVDLSFALATDAKVRLSGKDAKADDLKADMPVLVRFAADRKTITAIWAGPVRVKEKDDDDK